jgi:hypothetical protein
MIASKLLAILSQWQLPHESDNCGMWQKIHEKTQSPNELIKQDSNEPIKKMLAHFDDKSANALPEQTKYKLEYTSKECHCENHFS